MASQQRPKKITMLSPGMIAWASTWPDWETISGQESPHPILALGNNADGEIAVLPLSSKPDLGRVQITITAQAFSSAFKPPGPLSVSPTFICVADRQWGLNLRWVRVAAHALVLPKGRIALRHITKLSTSN